MFRINTAVCNSIARFWKNTRRIFCLHVEPGPTGILHNPSVHKETVVPVHTLHPSLRPILRNLYHLMSPSRRQHIPTPIKEQMVIIHWVHDVPKSKIAQLMDVHPSTVRRAVEKMRTTELVVKRPLQSGPRRALSGIDCAVGVVYLCSSDT